MLIALISQQGLGDRFLRLGRVDLLGRDAHHSLEDVRLVNQTLVGVVAAHGRPVLRVSSLVVDVGLQNHLVGELLLSASLLQLLQHLVHLSFEPDDPGVALGRG